VIVSWSVSEKLYYIGFSKMLFSVCFLSALGVLILSLALDIDLAYRTALGFAILLIAFLWLKKHPITDSNE